MVICTGLALDSGSRDGKVIARVWTKMEWKGEKYSKKSFEISN